MQPYFFPYLGYFSLIRNSDKWIFFDTPQYIRHGWVNRNRVLKPVEGWQYITVPLKKHERDATIKDIITNDIEDWKLKIIRQLEHYKKFAPFYTQTIQLIEKCFSTSTTSLSEVNIASTQEICRYLDIECNSEVFSKMNLSIDTVSAPDEWALNICKAIGATQYINPPGGLDFFDKNKYTSQNIDIKFLEVNTALYQQGKREFISNLSIIDVIMFNDITKIHSYLDDYKLI